LYSPVKEEFQKNTCYCYENYCKCPNRLYLLSIWTWQNFVESNSACC